VKLLHAALFFFLMLTLCFCRCKQAQPEDNGGAPIKREGLKGFFWKLSRIGERLSPYVGAGCAVMAIHILFFK